MDRENSRATHPGMFSGSEIRGMVALEVSPATGFAFGVVYQWENERALLSKGDVCGERADNEVVMVRKSLNPVAAKLPPLSAAMPNTAPA